MIDCAILGGGFAGLTAAVELSRRGKRVCVLEGKPHAGGRAYSFRDRRSGAELDNGQHILLGCYTSTLRLIQELGTREALVRIAPMRIPFLHADGRKAALRVGSLPHPLGLIQAFFGYGFLSFQERVGILRLALAVRNLTPSDLDALDEKRVDHWLRSLHQSARTEEVLWRPIVLATMNADIDQASAKLFAVVLREIFFGNREASALLLPRDGLSSLYVQAAVSVLERNASIVRTSTQVESVTPDAHGGFIVHCRNNDPVRSASVISALPPWALEPVLARSGLDRYVPHLDAFKPSEIVSVHMWTRRCLTDSNMTGLLGTTTQWLFLKEDQAAAGSWRYSCTISAANGAFARVDEMEKLLRKDMKAVFPWMRAEDIIATKTIRERRATFIPSPGVERFRPDVDSNVPGLFLAGDWTNTGLPATIESAVRSGYTAAGAVLEYR